MSFDGTSPADEPRQILVVRLGALGDIIHTLPAVVRLKTTRYMTIPGRFPLAQAVTRARRASPLPLLELSTS